MSEKESSFVLLMDAFALLHEEGGIGTIKIRQGLEMIDQWAKEGNEKAINAQIDVKKIHLLMSLLVK